MKFYNFLKQQYDDYKKYYDDYKNKGYIIAPCSSVCPCRTLIDKVIDPRKQIDCTNDIMYLADKYNIHGFNASLCGDCALTALKIAKKNVRKF